MTRKLTCIVLLTFVYATMAKAAVNLILRAESDLVEVGDIALFHLIAMNDSSDAQSVAAIDVILHWDALELGQIDISNNGPYAWIASGFLPEPDGINSATDDGDAVYTALASPAPPAIVPGNGELLVTTLEFEALAAAATAIVEIVAQQGQFARTRVLAPEPEQLDVLGVFSGASVTILECKSADSDSDGDTDLYDLSVFQLCFSGDGVAAAGVCECLFDFEPDSDVDLSDFEQLCLLFSGPSP